MNIFLNTIALIRWALDLIQMPGQSDVRRWASVGEGNRRATLVGVDGVGGVQPLCRACVLRAGDREGLCRVAHILGWLDGETRGLRSVQVKLEHRWALPSLLALFTVGLRALMGQPVCPGVLSHQGTASGSRGLCLLQAGPPVGALLDL